MRKTGAARAPPTTKDKGTAAPRRIVVALDHLDAVSPDRAREILEAWRRSAGDGMVALVAVDPTRHDASLLERCIDLPVRIAALEEPGALVAGLLGRGAVPGNLAKPNATASVFDQPLDPEEGEMLAGVAPLAGMTPRALRRFVGLYRLARLDGDAPRGALAFALALALGGTPEESEAVAQVLASSLGDFALPAEASMRLRAAHGAAKAYLPGLGEGSMAAAARQARRFAFRA